MGDYKSETEVNLWAARESENLQDILGQIGTGTMNLERIAKTAISEDPIAFGFE
jgi:hypothetical protein